jgi:hypothetical protein
MMIKGDSLLWRYANRDNFRVHSKSTDLLFSALRQKRCGQKVLRGAIRRFDSLEPQIALCGEEWRESLVRRKKKAVSGGSDGSAAHCSSLADNLFTARRGLI